MKPPKWQKDEFEDFWELDVLLSEVPPILIFEVLVSKESTGWGYTIMLGGSGNRICEVEGMRTRRAAQDAALDMLSDLSCKLLGRVDAVRRALRGPMKRPHTR